MPVMRSVFYVPGNNDKMIAKAPEIPADIITLDLEDSVPPAEKAEGPGDGPGEPETCRIGRLHDLRPDQQLGDPDDQRRPRSHRP